MQIVMTIETDRHGLTSAVASTRVRQRGSANTLAAEKWCEGIGRGKNAVAARQDAVISLVLSLLPDKV